MRRPAVHELRAPTGDQIGQLRCRVAGRLVVHRRCLGAASRQLPLQRGREIDSGDSPRRKVGQQRLLPRSQLG